MPIRRVKQVVQPVMEPVIEQVAVEPVKVKAPKKKRNINPDTMTYIKAFNMWKLTTGHKGISPKKNTKEYDEIMAIMYGHKVHDDIMSKVSK